MSDLKDLILENVNRKQENWRKIEFILSATHLNIKTIAKASTLARPNSFHNFGHQIGAAESVILLGREAGIPQEDIDILCLIMLVHDGLYDLRMQRINEIRAFEGMEMILQESDVRSINVPYETIMNKGRDLIMATVLSNRGRINSIEEKLVQDADLGHLGKGPIYWMWSSMGLVEEFSHLEGRTLSPVTFIRERQRKFIKFLEYIGNGHCYLTDAARNVFRNPAHDLETVLSYSDEQIMYAYNVRAADITLDAFTKEFTARA